LNLPDTAITARRFPFPYQQEAFMHTLAQSVITITRKAGDGHRFTLADRGAYTGVIASWLHTREAGKKETTSVKRR